MRQKLWLFALILTLVLSGSPAFSEASSLDSFDSADVIIGVPTGAAAMGATEARFPNAKMQYLTTDNDGYVSVMSGKIDAYAHDIIILKYACEEIPQLRLLEETYGETDVAAGISKMRADLTEPMNAFIQELIDSGVRDDMLKRWLTDAENAMPEIAVPEAPDKTIRVGTSGVVVPMTYYGADQALTGFDIEFLARFGLYMNAKIEISVLTYDALIAGLESGKLDLVVANLNITPERAERIIYSIPYMIAATGLVVKNEGFEADAKSTGFSSIEDLQAYLNDGKRLGVVVGSSHDMTTKEIFPGATPVYANTKPDMIEMLVSGKLDGYLVDKPQGYAQCLSDSRLWMPDIEIKEDHYAIAMALGREDLCAQINEVLARFKADGVLDSLADKWFLTDETKKPMTECPVSGEKGMLVLSTTGSAYPFTYMREDDAVGYDVELFGMICAELGYGCEIDIADLAGVVAAVSTGKADAAAGCLSITDERKEKMLFSDPTYDGGVMVMLPASLKPAEEAGAFDPRTLADYQAYFTVGKRMGLMVGTIFDGLSQKLFPDAEYLYFNTGTDLIVALSSGKIDGYLVDKPQGYAQCLVDDTLWMPDVLIANDNYGIALAQGNEELCAQMNEVIKRYTSDGTFEALEEKWFLTDEAKKPMADIALSGENGVLRLSTSGDAYPFSYVRDGEVVGYSIESFRMICAELGYGVEIQVSEFSGMIASVASGKVDAAAECISITDERKEQMLFTEPVYKGGVMMMLPASLKPVSAAEPNATDSAPEKTGFAAAWASVSNSFERTFIREARWKLIAQGLLTTLVISVCAALLGTLLGFGVCMARRSRHGILSGIAKVFIRIMQGTPIVVFLMILYYLVFGDIDPVLVAIIGFALNFAAYVSEMMRMGIAAVDKGQIEAASAIGFTKTRTFALITLPQAARHFLPVFRGEFINLVKMTSVVGYISIMDLTKMSDIIRSRTYEAFFPLIATAVIYFLLSWALAQGLSAIEMRIDPKHKKRVLKGVQEEGVRQ